MMRNAKITKHTACKGRIVITLLLTLLTVATAWAQETISGLTYNTAGGYYEIPNAAALNALATYVNAGHDASGKTFKQTADITFSHNSDWNNSGSSESNFSGIGTADLYFKGSYYGQEHTISGVRMSVWDQRVGLFRNVNNATIDGIVLADSRITGYHYTGGIVGYTYTDGSSCIVSNCHVRSDVLIHVIGNDEVKDHGGIAGYNGNGCVVTNCTSAVTMTGDSSCSFFGGIVGNNGGTASNNIAIGVTIGNISASFGAIAGSSGNGVLNNNYYFDCTVQGRTSNIGWSGSDLTANNGAVNASPDHFTASGDIFTIKSAVGWSVFRGALYHNDRYSRFSGKTVKLGTDIEVSSMAGTESYPFCGTFDGQGHTLTVSYANTDNNTYTAPFSHVDGATIQNLIVGGTITGTAYRAAGIIGETGSTVSRITNCVSSVDISGGQYTGGFSIGGKVRIEGCVFNGKINMRHRESATLRV